MEIIVLGTGCAKCKTVYDVVQKVVADAGIEAKLSKQEDIMEIMKYNVMSLPAVVVNGEVKLFGYVPSEGDVRKALTI